MTKPLVDEEALKSYLLGASSQTETELLDEMSISDDAFASRLSAVENDLVDAYIRGELSKDELAGFNSHYLASPMRRGKVTFSETFLAFADEASTVTAEEIEPIAPESKWLLGKRFGLSFFAVPHPVLLWGLTATALVFLLAGGYLVLENVRLRKQMTQTQSERALLEQRQQDLQRQLAEQHSSNDAAEKELEQVRERLAQIEQQPAGQRRSNGGDLKTIAFNLSPQTRGVGKIATLAVPVGIDYVALKLKLESADYPAYQVTLKNPATDQVIWRSGMLNANSSSKSKTISIKLRASLLKTQNYTAELAGMPRNGPSEIISSYSLKILLQ